LGLSKASLGAFQVAETMNFFPCILPPVPYCRLGIFSRAAIAREQDFFDQADIEDLVHVFFLNPRCRKPVHRRLKDDQVGSHVFFHLFLRVIAPLDKSLGDLIASVPRKTPSRAA
jgi:hypothetical protein